MARPISLQVHIDALRHNLQLLCRKAPNAKVWAVAKARGYGHGIEAAVRGFAQADGLAVLDLEEAEQARAAGWSKPILMIEGGFTAADLDQIALQGFETVVWSTEQMALVDRSERKPSRIWIKFNTGMNRLGFADQMSEEAMGDWAVSISQETPLPLGLMTHFSDADTDQGWYAQAAKFHQRSERLMAHLAAANLSVGPRSLANSAASLAHPETHADWIRPGIALYGASPFAGQADKTAQSLGLRPGQSLVSQLIAIQSVPAGESVGYGSRWTAKRPSRIGVIACGYADGYPRSAPDGTPVWVAGRLVPLAGRVSMDLLTVDLTDHAAASIGDPVELWGNHVAIDQVAALSGTIGYELMAGVTVRVPRVLLEP